jgi:dihydroorotase
MKNEENIFHLPAVIIDTHCHGRDMEESHKTTVRQVLTEAKSAGIGITLFMPNTKPPIIDLPALERYIGIIEEARLSVGIIHKQHVYFGVTDDNLKECDEALEYEQVIGLKIYPKSQSGSAVTTGSIGITKDSTIKKALQIARKYHKVVAFHCDDPIYEESIRMRHAYTEYRYVEKVLQISEKIPKVKIVICHVSCAESVNLVAAAQTKGLKVVTEFTPHHLWFTHDDEHWDNGIESVFYHCFNPLRSKDDRIALRKRLASNRTLTTIGSDSACHTQEEKLEKKLAGFPSNQELIPVICTLAKQLGLSEKRVANLFSFNAARFFNLRVPNELVPVKLEERIDELTYNHGKVVNPWIGSKLLFPKFKKEG